MSLSTTTAKHETTKTKISSPPAPIPPALTVLLVVALTKETGGRPELGHAIRNPADGVLIHYAHHKLANGLHAKSDIESACDHGIHGCVDAPGAALGSHTPKAAFADEDGIETDTVVELILPVAKVYDCVGPVYPNHLGAGVHKDDGMSKENVKASHAILKIVKIAIRDAAIDSKGKAEIPIGS